MKFLNKYLQSLSMCIMAAGLFMLNSCKIEPIIDPNNPSATVISQNGSLGDIQILVDGLESGMRNNLGQYTDGVGVIGREFFRFSTSDPRFTSDLLGKGSAVLDNNTFYTTNPFASRYRVVKNANILITAFQNTKAVIPDAQKKVGIAYAKTIQAHELLLVLNQQFGNGVRVDVLDPDNLGPFLSKDASLDAIQNLLNTANTDLLANSSTSFPFRSSLYGIEAGTFSKFNRALAARVAAYRADWDQVNTALAASFMDLNTGADLKAGVYYQFSTAGGDQLNPLFFPQNTNGETRVAHPSYLADIEVGDNRATKAPARTSNILQDGLSANNDFFVYKTNVQTIPIIRNAELVLLYAEAQTQATASNFGNARTAINLVRNAAGLSNSTANTAVDLINEILKQRRYELYGENHRWIDMRRYNRLAQLPIDRTGDDVWVQFPRPATEN
jgi:starch-binding outer membrane protein, SusD/RagB family